MAGIHGLSAQAVRNYEAAGFIPVAERTLSGYRVYTGDHARALSAYLGLVRGFGYATAGVVMTAIHVENYDRAFDAIDKGHLQLMRDRRTLSKTRAAVEQVVKAADSTGTVDAGSSFTVGDLARRLDVTTATLRNWERAGILTPGREAVTGYRVYRAADVRDAELGHLLRRGGFGLEDIAVVVGEVRAAGGSGIMVESLQDMEKDLVNRAKRMLTASALLSDYIENAISS